MKALNTLVDASLSIEKIRVRDEVRQTHLFLNGLKNLLAQGRIDNEQAEAMKKIWKKSRSYPEIFRPILSDPETDRLLKQLFLVEDYVDGRVAELIKDHPAYYWFSRVKGVGRENIGKIVGFVRIKPDPEHPPKNKDRPNYADSISALWKFAGWAPVDGHSMKRTKGQKLEYNSQLRSMCWRLGGSLLKAKGCFYEYYLAEKGEYQTRYISQGMRILPTPQGKWMCDNCGESWKRKGDIEPCCANQLIIKSVKQEPPNVIWEGHVHNQALRKMIKLFLACLWLTWRQAENLPVSKPYAIEKLGHTSFIDPWEMTEEKKVLFGKQGG